MCDFIEPFTPWWSRNYRHGRSTRAAVTSHLIALVVLVALIAAVVWLAVGR